MCFDLLPESMQMISISQTILGVLLGVIGMILCDILVQKKFHYQANKSNSLLKTGIIVSIGLALHNLPEGLAIGSGFGASIKLGYSLALAICLHDIPEGIAMGVPMKQGGMRTKKVIFYVIMSGIATGIGAFIGVLLGKVSEIIIGICLAFAGGAMLYLVSGELLPEANSLYHGRITSLGTILGFMLGILVTNL